MSEAEFRAKRRQKFLTEKYFGLNEIELAESREVMLQTLIRKRAEGKIDSSTEDGIFKNALKLLFLHYTAGQPIESLRPLYAEAMKWFEAWHAAERNYSVSLAQKSGEDLRLDMTPIEFGDLFHFQLALDMVSLAVLLGLPEQVRRAAHLMGSARHTDMLFEAIVEPCVDDPSHTEEFFHESPYGPLLDAIYTAKTPEEKIAFVKQYLDGWYAAFEGVPWHNGHLVVTDEYSNYEGYWAFEAAAVCLIHGIDDASFRDHMVYPKDLIDWARTHGSLDKIKASVSHADGSAERLRCEAGQPCPREGWWSTPAKADSRQHFKQGDVMPDLKSDYGQTIWQWDAHQA
jgi:hypothetical protein